MPGPPYGDERTPITWHNPATDGLTYAEACARMAGKPLPIPVPATFRAETFTPDGCEALALGIEL